MQVKEKYDISPVFTSDMITKANQHFCLLNQDVASVDFWRLSFQSSIWIQHGVPHWSFWNWIACRGLFQYNGWLSRGRIPITRIRQSWNCLVITMGIPMLPRCYLFIEMAMSNFNHWGRVTHICVGNLTIIGSDNGLSPGRRPAVIWTNAGILLIGPLGTNFSEILIEILTFSFKKMCLKVSSAKWCPFCLSLNLLTHWGRVKMDAISQTTLSNAFSWMKMYECRLKFHWNLFLRFQLTIFQHWFR